jgi:hypothetical protein
VTFNSNNKDAKEVPKGLLGKVAEIDKKGLGFNAFEGFDAKQWVSKSNFSNISVVLQEDELIKQAQLSELVAMLIAPTQAAEALDVPTLIDERATALMHSCVSGVCCVVELLVAEHIARCADLAASNGRGCTTLVGGESKPTVGGLQFGFGGGNNVLAGFSTPALGATAT